ncbi:MAG: coproporphyrinogen III oxidase [Deltaproteobacteria bacterium HGW-Deltaproteobacteria-9]|nr:MAG: coproporphyrinogen III oxidase [Deltaproteobacteria bacterium HGW-Deltaproteobacteria-9]
MQMAQPGLYIHIPFCKTKCGYCDFYSVTSLSSIPEYIKAILEEISLYRYDFKCFDTIYIGGGTPSLLSCADLWEILIHARNTFTVAADAEITVEVNPADAHPHFLTSLRRTGVNRLNLGIQSFDENILRFLDRRHTRKQALESIEQAQAAGFDNIGLDLIYGIPGQSLLSWKDTLSLALSFEPEHLSCYQLSLEDDTPLGRKHQKGEFALPDEDRQIDFFMTTADILEDAGYLHYEVSSFARDESCKSRHNQKYWRHIPYLGIGPAAHSFSGQRRWWNHRSIKQYLLDILEGRRPVEGSEQLTPSQKRLENCFLGLRTGEGIPMQHFSEQHNTPHPEKRKNLDELVRQGFIVIQDGFLKPTRRGLAVADRLALML